MRQPVRRGFMHHVQLANHIYRPFRPRSRTCGHRLDRHARTRLSLSSDCRRMDEGRDQGTDRGSSQPLAGVASGRLTRLFRPMLPRTRLSVSPASHSLQRGVVQNTRVGGAATPCLGLFHVNHGLCHPPIDIRWRFAQELMAFGSALPSAKLRGERKGRPPLWRHRRLATKAYSRHKPLPGIGNLTSRRSS